MARDPRHAAARATLLKRMRRLGLATGTAAIALMTGLPPLPGSLRQAAAQTLAPEAAPPTLSSLASGLTAANTPISGASIGPGNEGRGRPPSLEALMAARPGTRDAGGIPEVRLNALRDAALSLGARGGLAARGWAINENLRRQEGMLDRIFDFSGVVVPVAGGSRTLMVPPAVSEAELAHAIDNGGQVARESDRVYRITRAARLTSAPPNWRTYLVRGWSQPDLPPDSLRPRTPEEADLWKGWVAEGWSQGEAQAVEIFLSDLARLERELVGMARYNVLLRAGLVEAPSVAFGSAEASGNREELRLGDRTVRITGQGGLNANPRAWQGVQAEGNESGTGTISMPPIPDRPAPQRRGQR